MVYYMARPKSRQKSKIDRGTSQRKQQKEDDKKSGNVSQRKRIIKKPGSTQVYYAKNSGQKIIVRRIENRFSKQPNC